MTTNVAQLRKFLEQFPDDTNVFVVDGWANGKCDGIARAIPLQLQNPDGSDKYDHWDYVPSVSMLVIGIPS